MLQGVIYTYMLSSKIYVYTLQIICVIYMLCYIIYVYIIYTACDVMLCYVVYFIRIYIYMLYFSASVQEKPKQTAHPFIPGKGCFVSRNELGMRQF